LCGFKINGDNSIYKWERTQGTDNIPDHTIGSQIGHYMITKFASPHIAGRTARLFSPEIQNPTSSCVSFWYKTFGPIEFNVKKLQSNGIYDPNVIFTAKGDRGSEWSLGRGTLTQFALKVQIVFEAVDQVNSMVKDAEVWIDDFEINYSESCAPIASCNFESDICGFSYSRAGDFDWVRLNGIFGLNQNIWSVPTFDHTTNKSTGSFLYLDTNGKTNGKKAIIESEIVSEAAGTQCLQFYLKTNSNNKATLKVTQKNKINGNQVDFFSTNEANNGDFWMLKQVQIPAAGFAYSFLIQGIVGQNVPGQNGQLAIDDFELLNRICSDSTTIKPTVSGQTYLSTVSTASTVSEAPVTFNPQTCPPGYCLNGGICFSSNNQFKCNCTVGYTGQRCESLVQNKKGSNSKYKLILFGIYFIFWIYF